MEISSPLAAKLDSILPNWRDYIDQEQLKTAQRTGAFGDGWLLRHLLNQNRKRVYEENRNMADAVAFGSPDRSEEAIMGEFRKLNEALDINVKNLLSFEEEILKMMQADLGEQGVKDAENIRRITRGLMSDLTRAPEVYEQQAVDLFELTLDRARQHDISRADQLVKLLNSLSGRFRREYRKNAKSQRDLLAGKLFNNFLINRMSTLEMNKLASKIANMMVSEVRSQKRMRTECANFVLKRMIKKSNASAIIGFFDQVQDLGDQSKKLLREVINSGYFPHYLANSTPGRKKKSTHGINSFSRGMNSAFSGLNRAIDDLNERQKGDQDSLNEIFNSSIYKVCNGGWWSVLAHIGSLGFCSGFTITTNLIVLFRRRMVDRRNIFIALDTVFFFSFLPFQFTGTLMFSPKFLEMMQLVRKMHGDEYLKKFIDLIAVKLNDFTQESKELMKWLIDFLHELIKVVYIV